MKCVVSNILAVAEFGIAAKPEDRDMCRDIFAKPDRLKDLIVFDAEGGNRCNFLGHAGKRPRNVVHSMTPCRRS